MENQTPVKLLGPSKVGTTGSFISPTNGLVIGVTKVGKIKLFGQKKPFWMLKRDFSQVVTKHVLTYL